VLLLPLPLLLRPLLLMLLGGFVLFAL